MVLIGQIVASVSLAHAHHGVSFVSDMMADLMGELRRVR